MVGFEITIKDQDSEGALIINMMAPCQSSFSCNMAGESFVHTLLTTN